MVVANWHWWTYIKVGDYLASRGCILEINFAARWIKYQKVINFPEDGVFDRGVFEGPFEEIWVDPARSLTHPKELIVAMDKGVVPTTYVKLEDQDPRDYFNDARVILSSYLPEFDASRPDRADDHNVRRL